MGYVVILDIVLTTRTPLPNLSAASQWCASAARCDRDHRQDLGWEAVSVDRS